MQSSFSLIALNIPKNGNRHIQKILKQGFYIFDKRYSFHEGFVSYTPSKSDAVLDGLYGENIHVHAIVGKNGSGKSSLLEIIYRIINNLSFSLLTISSRPNRFSLYQIHELYADLYYVADDYCYCISCQDSEIVWRKQKLNPSKQKETIYASSTPDKLDKTALIAKCQELFYTVVTNYSPHSLIPDEYVDEPVSRLYKNIVIPRDETSWLPSIFHKNDGYMTPITLVPYRENDGSINMTKELQLTKYRLSSIFLYYDKELTGVEGGNQMIDSYSLHDITYTLNQGHATEKYYHCVSSAQEWLPNESANAIGNKLLNALGLYHPDVMKVSRVFELGCVYLAAKVYYMVNTYPSYSSYKAIFTEEEQVEGHLRTRMYAITMDLRDKDKELFDELIDKLNEDKSHITIKFRQTKALLEYILRCKDTQEYAWLTSNALGNFSYKTYIKHVHENVEIKSIEDVQALLPPPIYDIDLFLCREYVDSDNGVDKKKSSIVKLSELSSGERQLLFVLSTYIYHVLNLISNSKEQERVSYRNVCLVLDEVEICFHPDYQRQFIYRLVNALADLGLNKSCSFNILLATHSPFILSDIPQPNILYLEDGKDVGNQIKVNPFCANVNDILFQSFFLNNGFSGAFAINKVKSLMEYLKTTETVTAEWNEQNAGLFVDEMIGDPFMKEALNAMLNNKPRK